MEASELVPSLRPAFHPVARLLLLAGTEDEISQRLPHGSGDGKRARLLQMADKAIESGHLVEMVSSDHVFKGEDNAPDAVIVDGLTAPSLAQMQELRALPELENVPFVALIGPELGDDDLTLLQRAGASSFINVEASPLEVSSRLRNLIELSRARTENARLRERIARQLRVDDVTGVMTRRFFFQQAHRECARARRYGHPLACLMVEVDHYRMLCATFSDNTGEAVLRAVATTIGQWTRDSDVVARFAESKFVVLLPETDLDGATSAREKVLIALRAHPWRFDNQILPVSVSIGEAQLKHYAPAVASAEHASESDEMGETALSTREAMAGLLEDSDAALYVARKGARVPEVFVPYTPAPDEIPILASI